MSPMTRMQIWDEGGGSDASRGHLEPGGFRLRFSISKRSLPRDNESLVGDLNVLCFEAALECESYVLPICPFAASRLATDSRRRLDPA